MNYREILIFNISGEYGHFRKFNTTTSPLTYSIPPRTAIIGIIGAILGIEREEDNNKFKPDVIPLQEQFGKSNAEIAIQIINPIKKKNVCFNLIDTKHSFFNIKNRTQIEFELLQDVEYRIFFSFSQKDIFETVTERIKNKNHHFTPYLGLSQFTASIEFVDVVNAEIKKKDEFAEFVSVINLSKVKESDNVKFDYDYSHYTANIMPVEMDRERNVLEYSEILFEKNGKIITGKFDEYFDTGNYGNIVFL
jgi:CRISPR-associated protein Cas5h